MQPQRWQTSRDHTDIFPKQSPQQPLPTGMAAPQNMQAGGNSNFRNRSTLV